MKENLNDSHKARRHRRNMLNIQITFLAWLFETIGFFILFLGQFILGHENNIVIFSMQTLSVMIYFNILPSILILNDTNFKNVIVDSQWYDHFLKGFGCHYKTQRNAEENNSEWNEISYQLKWGYGIQLLISFRFESVTYQMSSIKILNRVTICPKTHTLFSYIFDYYVQIRNYHFAVKVYNPRHFYL